MACMDLINIVTPPVPFAYHIGMLLAWSHSTNYYHGDTEHTKRMMLRANGKNLLLGWWSIMSIFINPWTMIANVVVYLMYKRDAQKWEFNPMILTNEYVTKRTANYKTTLTLITIVGPLFTLFAIVAFSRS